MPITNMVEIAISVADLITDLIIGTSLGVSSIRVFQTHLQGNDMICSYMPFNFVITCV